MFKQEYGTEGGVKLHEVLWQFQSLVAGVKGNIASRRILLLTCDPDPHVGDQTLNIQVFYLADFHNYIVIYYFLSCYTNLFHISINTIFMIS